MNELEQPIKEITDYQETGKIANELLHLILNGQESKIIHSKNDYSIMEYSQYMALIDILPAKIFGSVEKVQMHRRGK